MGLLEKLEVRASVVNPVHPRDPVLAEWFGGDDSPTGVTVTERKALGVTAFWAGCLTIGQTVAAMYLQVFERQDQGRRLARDHHLYRVLHDRANPEMSASDFRVVQTIHKLTWGNRFAEIERDGAGRVIALWPLLPDRTWAERINGVKVIKTIIGGRTLGLPADRVLHIRGPGGDGLNGYNVVRIHAASLGLSLATQEYAGRFFGNSARPGGYLWRPKDAGALSKEARDRLREEWQMLHGGLTNAHRTAILQEGMEFKPLSLPPEEAQFIQTRGVLVEEVAQILNMNPILLHHHDKVTTWGSGVEQFMIAASWQTFMPHLDAEEQEINWALFPESERGRFFAEANMDRILRGDSLTRAQVLEIRRRNGTINADEWRALENENPMPDGQGKVYLVPLNMTSLEQVVALPEPGQAPTGEGASTPQSEPRGDARTLGIGRMARACAPLFRDAFFRVVRYEAEAVGAALKRAVKHDDLPGFMAWMEDFYRSHEAYVAGRMTPIVEACAGVVGSGDVEAYTRGLAERHIAESKRRLAGLAPDAVADELDTWGARAEQAAAAETERAVREFLEGETR